jgi:hypothetical protein
VWWGLHNVIRQSSHCTQHTAYCLQPTVLLKAKYWHERNNVAHFINTQYADKHILWTVLLMEVLQLYHQNASIDMQTGGKPNRCACNDTVLFEEKHVHAINTSWQWKAQCTEWSEVLNVVHSNPLTSIHQVAYETGFPQSAVWHMLHEEWLYSFHVQTCTSGTTRRR